MSDHAEEGAADDGATTPRSDDRRRFLSRLTWALGAALGAAVAIGPAAVALTPLFRRNKGADTDWNPVGPKARFAIGGPAQRVVLRQDTRDSWLVRRRVAIGSVLVQRTGPSAFRVFSAVCPHLGCAVGYQADSGTYSCPCHKSAFAADGGLLGEANPAPRGLDALPWRLRRGRLEVQWLRYKSGTSERIAVT